MPDIGDCVLCGATGVELCREDGIPVWVLKLLGGPKTVWLTRKDGTREKLLDAFRADTCRPCNEDMGRMYENHPAAKRVLRPLLTGEPVFMSDEDQRFVARWVVKTTLMMRAAVPLDPRPELLRHFRRNTYRLPGAVVWIAKYDPYVRDTHPNAVQPWMSPEEAAPRHPKPIGDPPLPFPYVLRDAPLAHAEPLAVGALATFVRHMRPGPPLIFERALDRLMFRLPGGGPITDAVLPTVTAQTWADICVSTIWSRTGS